MHYITLFQTLKSGLRKSTFISTAITSS